MTERTHVLIESLKALSQAHRTGDVTAKYEMRAIIREIMKNLDL